MLRLSFYEWRGIYPGDQLNLAPFLEKISFDRAARRFASYLFASKHAKADVLSTTVLGSLSGGHAYQVLVGQIARHLATPDGHHRG